MNKFDPKLKEAVEEIKIILKKYDAQACMLLVSPTHCEYLYYYDTSWSVMRFEAPENADPARMYVRFRSKKEDFPSKEAQDFATESTVHAVTSMLQFGRMTMSNCQKMLEMLKSHMKIGYKIWD